MRTEEEIRKAAEAFAWYMTHRYPLQDRDTQLNLIGSVAMIEWVLQTNIGGDRNPIAGVLRDIAALRQKSGNN